jgi:hypothetical protein
VTRSFGALWKENETVCEIAGRETLEVRCAQLGSARLWSGALRANADQHRFVGGQQGYGKVIILGWFYRPWLDRPSTDRGPQCALVAASPEAFALRMLVKWL